MIANFVMFRTKPGRREEFVAANLANSRGSINGDGCIATSIFEDPDRPDVSYVFEVFTDQEAFEAHHAADYYAKFLSDIGDLLAEPFQMLQSTSFPGRESFDHLRMAVVGSSTIWP